MDGGGSGVGRRGTQDREQCVSALILQFPSSAYICGKWSQKTQEHLHVAEAQMQKPPGLQGRATKAMR